jgi:glycosyltransferase involved in cell wall biosynthesis
MRRQANKPGLKKQFLKVAICTTDNRENERLYSIRSPYFGTALQALLEGMEGLNDLEVHVLSCTQKVVEAPLTLGKNIFFHSLLVPRWGWLRTGYWGCVRAVRSKLAYLKPDLVHGQGTERDCAITAALSGFPSILTIHGNIRSISKFYRSRPLSYWWLQARIEQFCIPRSRGVVCISTYTQSLVSGLAQKTWVVPNAVDTRFFRAPPYNPPPTPLFLVVAQVARHKNQVVLIESLDGLARTQIFRLRFLGKCGEDHYGQRFQELLKTRKWCEWGGSVDQKTLRDELAKATALILPTKEDNCPMVILEAQASGVPVIASAIGGIPDLIENGKTGLLVDPTSLDSLRSGIEKILCNTSLAAQLGIQARKQAWHRYHPKAVAEQHVQIYKEVVKSL